MGITHKEYDPQSTAMLKGVNKQITTLKIKYHDVRPEVKLNARVSAMNAVLKHEVQEWLKNMVAATRQGSVR